jgi:hypothetical protein
MFAKLKEFFFGKPTEKLTEPAVSVPYKIETPAPVAESVPYKVPEPAMIVELPGTPVILPTTASVKKAPVKKKPAVKKAPVKSRAKKDIK